MKSALFAMNKTLVHLAGFVVLWLVSTPADIAQQGRPLERVRLTVPAKSLTFIPYYFGKAQGFFAREGVDLEIIVMRPPLGVTALAAGEVDYSAAGGLAPRTPIGFFGRSSTPTAISRSRC